MTGPYKGKLATPGGRLVPVKIITKRHIITTYGGRVAVPLLHQSCGIKYVAECIKERVDHARDALVVVCGDRGLGKSTFILRTALAIDPNFSLDNVSFRLEEYSAILNRNPQGDGVKGIYPQVVMDEAGFALYGLEWLAREQRVVAKETIVSRIRRQIIYMAVPRLMLLNYQMRGMASMMVVVSEPQEFLQGYAQLWFAPSYIQSPFKSDRLWSPKAAILYESLDGPFWDEYERRKLEFVRSCRDRIDGDRTGIILKLRERGMTQQEIADLIGCSQQTVSKNI